MIDKISLKFVSLDFLNIHAIIELLTIKKLTFNDD